MLTRNLIILQQIIQRCGFPDEVSDGTTEIIHSTFLPTYVVLNLSYFILTWITETNATAPPSDSLEQGLRQMAVLKISSRSQNTGKKTKPSRILLCIHFTYLRNSTCGPNCTNISTSIDSIRTIFIGTRLQIPSFANLGRRFLAMAEWPNAIS